MSFGRCQIVISMSELYLVLRSRLESVAEWVTIGDELSLAQKARGFSDERVAREFPVSTRTWIRWRTRGQVPIHMLDRAAEILHLEIERPARRSVALPEEEAVAQALDQLSAQLAERDAELTRLLVSLDRKLDVEITPRLDALEAAVRDLARQMTPASTP